MVVPSSSHLVIIPSYNTGAIVLATAREARQYWQPVWVVMDGSTDGSAEAMQALANGDPGLEVLVLPHNQGKGAAVLHGLREAARAGYTHALTMDADGQHPASMIPEFMAASRAHPRMMVLGLPIFDASAPLIRVRGRKLSNWWVNVETLWQGIGDSLFGFRIYPVVPLLGIMQRQRWMRRFDFDAEAAVRLCWSGVRPLNIAAPVRYFSIAEGGVSHFNYVRDNILLTWMHLRLIAGFLARLPLLIWQRARPQKSADSQVLRG